MAALREAFPEHDDGEERREAYMRQSIRAAAKAGAENVAVVCGAWHAPALAELGPAAPDQRTLRGLPKVKVAATWVPWTYGLLARDSGYGAGVDSPAWYDQLFDAADQPVARWLARAARLLRAEGLDASAAQVVDATRLAGALAGVRERPLAGPRRAARRHPRRALPRLRRAARARPRASWSSARGSARCPTETPMVPLQQDVARLQRRLRLKPEASVKELTLDLRRPNDRERSRLLHRLNLLEVPWGTPAYVSGALGTFKEAFRLEWQPALALDLIHAGRWGTTVEAAAAAKARAERREQESIAALAALADAVLLADLPDALDDVLRALADRAALDRDTADLMAAVPPLAGILRYGDVRGSDTTAVAGVLRGIVLRSAVGLPGAGVGADEETGATLADARRRRQRARSRCSGRAAHPRLARGAAARRGRRPAPRHRSPAAPPACCYDAGETDPPPRCPARSPRARSPSAARAWIEGFIGTSGLVLVHDPDLLAILDGWIATVAPDAFTNVLPLLRRAFSVLPAGERRRLGERLSEPKAGQSRFTRRRSTPSARRPRWRPSRGCSGCA